MKFLCSVVLFLLGSSWFLSAQSNQEIELKQYVFRVLFIDDTDYSRAESYTPGIPLKFATDSGVFQIAAMNNSLSRPFRYVGPETIVFFEEGPMVEGVPVRTPIVSCRMGQTGDKIVIIRKTQNGKILSHAVHVDGADFKRNQIRLFNLSSQPLRAKVGDAVKDVAKRQVADFSAKPKGTRPVIGMAIAAYDGEKPYMVAKKKMVFKPNSRKVLLTYNSPRNPNQVVMSEFLLTDYDKDFENKSDDKPGRIDTVGPDDHEIASGGEGF